jgi:hypothetical protein
VNTRIFAILGLAMAGIMLAPQSARAEIVFGNLGPNGTDPLGPSAFIVTPANQLAQAFTTPVSGGLLELESITLSLNVGFGTSQAGIRILTDNAGTPTGSILADLTTMVASPTTSLYTFTLNSPLTLANNTTYWVAAYDPDMGVPFNWIFNDAISAPTGQNGSGYTYPSGGTMWSSDSGITWADRTINQHAGFYVTAKGVPEPGTWAAGALLVGGAILTRILKRRAKI